jgi:hypothetical protein
VVLRVGTDTEAGRTVSGYQPQRPSSFARLTAVLERLLFAPKAITKDGVGVNLTEAMVMLAEATDRLVKVLETFPRAEE